MAELKDALNIGERLENHSEVYEIKKILNKGGFSFIYEADMIIYAGTDNFVRQEVFRKEVVIKELFISDRAIRRKDNYIEWNDENQEGGLSKKIRVKTKSEAIKLRDLSSPHILKIITAFEKNNTVYIVTEKIYKSIDFGEVLGMEVGMTPKPLPVDRALKYINEVGEALKEVHDKNIIHLDIKPDNIMLDQNDNAILIDFGISISIDEQRETTLLSARTPHYSPPEQASNTLKSIGFSSDLYALGCTFYVFLTTKLVPDYTEVITGDADVFPPSRFNPEVSPYLDEVILKSISIPRDQRYQTVDEFIKALNGEQEYLDLVAKAKNSAELGDYSEASKLLNETLKFIPFTDELKNLDERFKQGYERELNEDEKTTLLNKASTHFEKKEFEKALEIYLKFPENTELTDQIQKTQRLIKAERVNELQVQAQELQNQGKLKEAVEVLIELKKISQTGWEVDERINELQKAIAREEEFTEIIRKANAYFSEGNYSEAIIQYNIAIDLKPTETESLGKKITECENQLSTASQEEVGKSDTILDSAPKQELDSTKTQIASDYDHSTKIIDSPQQSSPSVQQQPAKKGKTNVVIGLLLVMVIGLLAFILLPDAFSGTKNEEDPIVEDPLKKTEDLVIEGEVVEPLMIEEEIVESPQPEPVTNTPSPDELAWEQATQVNTKKAYQDYVKNTPSGTYVSQAKQKIKEFEAKETSQANKKLSEEKYETAQRMVDTGGIERCKNTSSCKDNVISLLNEALSLDSQNQKARSLLNQLQN